MLLLDANVKRIMNGGGYTYRCPECQGNLFVICRTCSSGIMAKPEPHSSGDFSPDGYIDNFCTHCLHGYLRFVEKGEYYDNYFSRRQIRAVLDKTFIRRGLLFKDKDALLDELFAECHSKKSVIKFIVERTGEKESFLIRAF